MRSLDRGLKVSRGWRARQAGKCGENGEITACHDSILILVWPNQLAADCHGSVLCDDDDHDD